MTKCFNPKIKICFEKGKNIVGKGENTGYMYFLLFQEGFQRFFLCCLWLGFCDEGLTHYQTTNFRLFQTDRQQFQILQKWKKVVQTGRKHCGKRRNCLCGNGLNQRDLPSVRSLYTVPHWAVENPTSFHVTAVPVK